MTFRCDKKSGLLIIENSEKLSEISVFRAAFN
jgi:hypothetical protein